MSDQVPMTAGDAATVVPTDAFWAKLDDDRTSWHPLVGHSADVAAVVRCLLQPDTPLAARAADVLGLDRLPDSTRRALVYLAALHDVGKAHHGFQERRHPHGERRRFERAGHVKVVHESMDHPPLATVLMEFLHPLGGDREIAFRLFASALFHHGRPWGENASEPRDPERLWGPDAQTGRDPLGEMRRIADLAHRWSGLDEVEGEAELPRSPAFTHLYAGVVMLADWIGSTEAAFPFSPDAEVHPDAHWKQAVANAERACARIGVIPRTRVPPSTGSAVYRRVFPWIFEEKENDPTPLQRRIAEMPVPDSGSRILIESETGSGKTEAALALYARLRAAGQVGGLVFALPTRATATAMYERIARSLEGMYADDDLPTVALAMGGTGHRAEAQEALFESVRIQYDDEEDRRLATWSSSSAKKFLSAEIVVGTVDQVLLSGLVVDHAHLRLAALVPHLVVVDELHSYDRYMAEVLARVLDFHTSAGGVSLFMSATLSDVERRRFGGNFHDVPTRDEAVERAYPVVSVRDRAESGWTDTTVADQTGTSIRNDKHVTWELASSAEGLSAAVEAAQEGARVCVLRNLVKDARSTVASLRQDGDSGLLWCPPGSEHGPAYHSRYHRPDRSAMDDAVLDRFGPDATSDEGGVILVATQVVEQSLDVDFDLLITDLCPVDVLLQRIGRLHRHADRDERRPECCREARVLVVGPDQDFENVADGRGYGPHGWGTVYEDLGDLELTRRLVADEHRPEIEIPRDNRELVERVYHADPREALRAESSDWEDSFIENEGKNLGRECHARNVTVDFESDYAANAGRWTSHEGEGSVRTRLGDDHVRVELDRPVPCWYGASEEPVEAVDLPVRVLGDDWDGQELEVSAWTEHEDGSVSFEVDDAGRVSYEPDGWHWPGER